MVWGKTLENLQLLHRPSFPSWLNAAAGLGGSPCLCWFKHNILFVIRKLDKPFIDRQLVSNPAFFFFGWGNQHDKGALCPGPSHEKNNIFQLWNVQINKFHHPSHHHQYTLHNLFSPTVLIVLSRALVTKNIWRRKSFSGSYIWFHTGNIFDLLVSNNIGTSRR